MSFDITVSGAALEAVDRIVPQLVSDLVASRIAGQDSTLWGPDAEAEATKRLGWTEAVVLSDPLVPDILALRDRLHTQGVDHIVLGGMGGSSLAPEVITRTSGVELTILDTTSPGQIAAALADRLTTTAVVISSKSGSTVETDSQKRLYEQSFRDAGVDPIDRIVIVTDPGSPLDVSARADGYRVFNADPNVGGRYSALTAFGLVPSGLAGVDIAALLDDASSVAGRISVDQPDNPALILGAAIAGTRPLKNKLGLVADGTYIVGFPDWAEQLIAESTGKLGKGILPVVLGTDAAELSAGLPDLQVVRLVESANATDEVEEGEIEISGTRAHSCSSGRRRSPSPAAPRHQPVRSARCRIGQGSRTRPARRPSGAERACVHRIRNPGPVCGCRPHRRRHPRLEPSSPSRPAPRGRIPEHPGLPGPGPQPGSHATS